MLEVVCLALVAWLLLAAASFRHRRALDLTAESVRGLRLAAATLLAIAFFRCGTSIDGERCVRFLGGASIAAVVLVAFLSVAPNRAMRPIALLLRIVAALHAYFASRPSSNAAGSNAKSCAGSGAA